MKFRMYFIGLVLGGVVLFGCGETKEVKQIQTEKTTIPKEVVSSIKQQQIDTIYPKEFKKEFEFYKRLREGIYVYETQTNEYSDRKTERLDFFDKKGELNNVFDVEKHNPYNLKTIPKLKKISTDYPHRSFARKSKNQKVEVSEYNTHTQRTYAKMNPIIGYHLLSINEETIVDWKFTAICFDENGEILKIFKDLDIDPVEFCLSKDKKFFCVSYGGLRGENLERIRNSGFRIYEVETGNIVYEKTLDRTHKIGGPGCDLRYNLVGINIRGNDFSKDDSVEIIYFNLDKREVYSSIFDFSKEKNVGHLDVAEDGIIMYNGKTKEKWKILFKDRFQTKVF